MKPLFLPGVVQDPGTNVTRAQLWNWNLSSLILRFKYTSAGKWSFSIHLETYWRIFFNFTFSEYKVVWEFKNEGNSNVATKYSIGTSADVIPI